MSQHKLCKRIIGLDVNGEHIKLTEDQRLYGSRKHYILKVDDVEINKWPLSWVSMLYKANTFNGGIQEIAV